MRCCTGEFLQLVELVTDERSDHNEGAKYAREAKELFKSTVDIIEIFS
jgi:hypothetical protein